MKPSTKEINDQINAAYAYLDDGTKYPGMCFEEGVAQALEWILGESPDKPMEED